MAESAIKTNEQIEEEDILWREQMHEEEFDYLDMQINRSEKIKQQGRDKALTKKNAAGPSKEEQQKMLKEQNRLKQLKIQEKKRMKEEEQQIQAKQIQAKLQQQMQAKQMQAKQSQTDRLLMDQQMLAEFNKTEKKMNADDLDWEDLY